MSDIDFHRALQVLETLVGKSVRVDDVHTGKVLMVLGGPQEIFFVIDIDGEIMYVDTLDPTRIEILE